MSAISSAANNVSLTLRFSNAMQQLVVSSRSPKLCVACSGGADSLACTLLAHEWAQAQGGQITALIIDHGLRAESAAEADQAAQWLTKLNIKSHIITLCLDAGGAAIQERARDARYQAMQDWCAKNNIDQLITGHHADDQIETMLFRLLRGSGAHGLAAMSAKRTQGHLAILRPMLGFSKYELVSYLRERDQQWIEDSSNLNDDFARIRLRQWLSDNINTRQRERLIRLNRAFSRLRHADESWLFERTTSHAQALPYGILEVNRALLDEPAEAAIWMLKHLLATCNGTTKVPRQHDVQRLYNDLLCTPEKTRSLHCCLVIYWRGKIIICREPARAETPLAIAPNKTYRWDNRFTLQTPENLPPNCIIGTLGAKGVSKLKEQQTQMPDLPHQTLLALPAIWRLEELYFVPHMNDDSMKDMSLSFEPAKELADTPFFIMNEALKQ